MAILNGTLSKQVYGRIKDRFLGGEYLPGDRIFEDDLAREYGVSLTPIREAMQRFQAEGLVVRKEHRALYVRSFTLEEAQNVYEMRELLEPYAIELATRHFDSQWLDHVEAIEAEQRAGLKTQDFPSVQRTNYYLHVAFAEGSHNPILVEMIERLWVFVPVLRAVAWRNNAAGPLFSADEHAEIIAHLRNHRAEEAVAAARRHVLGSWERVRRKLEDELPQLASKPGANEGGVRA
jgi:DNA-binding GntR family transcriptional regulator